jgi:mono/diheme cytochrome c family protein
MPRPLRAGCWLVLLWLGGLALSGETNAPVVVPPIDEALVPEGRYVYERNCQVCHGRWGDGRGEMAQGMWPRPRKLTAGQFKFRSTPTGALPTDADLERTIRGGIFGTSMPVFHTLSDREVKAVIQYVKTLSPRWRRPENYAAPVSLPAPPEWFGEPAALKTHAASGERLFQQLCAVCHGAAGRGDGPAVEGLEDEQGQPARPADLHQPSIKSGPERGDFYKVLATGLNGTPMPSFLEATTEEERWDLVAYLEQLRREGTAAAGSP